MLDINPVNRFFQLFLVFSVARHEIFAEHFGGVAFYGNPFAAAYLRFSVFDFPFYGKSAFFLISVCDDFVRIRFFLRVYVVCFRLVKGFSALSLG